MRVRPEAPPTLSSVHSSCVAPYCGSLRSQGRPHVTVHHKEESMGHTGFHLPASETLKLRTFRHVTDQQSVDALARLRARDREAEKNNVGAIARAIRAGQSRITL